MPKTYAPVPEERIITFSDAVMAILMTLLALDLRAPELGPHLTIREYQHALMPLTPHFVSFASRYSSA